MLSNAAGSQGVRGAKPMFRKFVLASVAAASLGVGALGGSTEASANPWGGYGGPHHGYYGGPPPWARAWGWRRHHHHWGHVEASLGAVRPSTGGLCRRRTTASLMRRRSRMPML